MTTAARRWRELLEARAIPPGIRAAAPDDPHRHDPAGSLRWARPRGPDEVELARRRLCLPRHCAEDVARALDALPQGPRGLVTLSWDR